MTILDRLCCFRLNNGIGVPLVGGPSIWSSQSSEPRTMQDCAVRDNSLRGIAGNWLFELHDSVADCGKLHGPALRAALERPAFAGELLRG